ncbi:epoxyqueuosine reductase QueH [Patescibacteria group bacterium]|nr:epoxyqueuosine reductase QueH [Patescibacteria group bacterium]MBU1895477.1 epoxyqueuosine reductase QueH [Patescibacteria group bacterium]
MKPKFLLHVCCGPCSIAIFEELQNQFDLTVHFYNPNIHPVEEYDKRKSEVFKICSELNIPVVEGSYDDKRWFELTKEYKDEPESGERCSICFRIRMEHSAEYARDNIFDFFSTSLTMGRNKKADVINLIGVELGEKYGVEFYEEDWKKGGRQERADELVKKKRIYRQDYCGCVYSK